MEQQNKPHRPSKKSKDKKKAQHTGQQNPKAFAFSNPGKLAKQAARSHDIKEKRLHVPQVDRLPDEPPPRLVTIVGPPGVGKTTLLKSLIRRYAKETMSDPVGPITVVTSKKQRLTFIECPNELEAMVDIAKVADIVLLMIDGNFGFEMETMEFLNVLAATGMPGNVFGILTHLDLFRKPQALKDAKKRLKHRLWNELYQGAHLFYLSGVLNGRYPDREIHNLSRFLSVMKNPRPLVWRNSHPYTVIDNYRDITHPTKIEEDENCDRSIELSGYLRGTNFAADGQRIHIAGLGDFTIASMEALPDPCPTPSMEQALAKATGKTGRRRLDEKDKKLWAPMADRSGLKITGDHIVITRENGFAFDKDAEDVERGEGEQLIVDLQGERKLLGSTDKGVKLFASGQELTQVPEEADSGRKTRRKARFAAGDEPGEDEIPDDEGFESGEEDEEGSDVEEDEFDMSKLGKMFKKQQDKDQPEDDLAFADSDSDLGSLSGDEDEELDSDEDDEDVDMEDLGSDEEAGALKWKDSMFERASKLHGNRRPFRAVDLARFMYDTALSPREALKKWRCEEEEEEEEDIEKDEDDTFFRKIGDDEQEDLTEDRAIPSFDYEDLAAKWSSEDAVEALRTRFSTANLVDEEGRNGDDDDFSGLDDDDEDDEGDGAFEDLETGEAHGGDGDEDEDEDGDEDESEEPPEASLEAEREKNARRKEELKLRFEEEDREGFKNDKAVARREGGGDDEFGEDDWYDAQKALLQKQLDINKAEFEELDERQRTAVEGFRAGKYGKIVLEGVPAEFVKNFSAKRPIIVGGLSATEDRFGFVQVRIKKHRWHKRILKTGDPLIFSLGWRRFQSLPIYSISDSRTRNRMLKYTPEHMHCFGTFYGPLIAPNTSFTAFQSFSSSNPGFRIAATGTVLSVDESTEIVKKLKLTGTPYKIFKNTAFIKDMFNTALEIAKFEGAAIKTVSGVRGQIKRALSKPDGHFRATFEDKILLSDIVFLRAWYPIKPHRFYNPATNLIGWQSMRSTGEIRRAEDLATPQLKNSQYRKIERQERHFNPLRVPKKLAAELPFKSQIVQTKKQRKETYMQKRAVVVSGEERKARDLMQKLTTIRKEQVAKRKAKKEEKRQEYRKKVADIEERLENREKKEKQAYWEREGKKRRAGDGGGGGGKRRK
ncbi:Putative Ribosome biogenesis protein BMS1 homolog [Podospora comata]|uniref:Ribosome biogenesis protein BMS1 homolog n=1 Tax=Podospora comata TaxID=48703 RepID=A0ABY6S5V7_PODCO|nr:Putative Ribosome biogenesis protein BMS1 homolog [Podospora comata]